MSAPRPEPPEPVAHRRQIQLNVISPSVEIQKLIFPDLATTCTIAGLKLKIRDASPTKVEPSQQKLIYRGHVLLNDQRTLAEVFGQDTIDGSDEPLTIHLIVPPATPSEHASSASASQPPRAASAASQALRPTPTVPAPPNASTIPANHSNDTSNTAPPIASQNHGHANANGDPPQAAAPIPLPPQAAAAVAAQQAAQLHAIHQQINAQMAAIHGMQPMVPLQAGQTVHTHFGPTPPNARINVQQQIPAAPAPLNQMYPTINTGFQSPASIQRNTIGDSMGRPPGIPVTDQRPGSAPPHSSQGLGTVIREHVGPHGERWQTITRPLPFQANATLLNAPQSRHLGDNQMPRSRSSPGATSSGPETTRPGTEAPDSTSATSNTTSSNRGTAFNPPFGPPGTVPVPMSATPRSLLQNIQNHFNAIDNFLNLGHLPDPHLFGVLSSLMQSAAPLITSEHYSTLLRRHASILGREAALRSQMNTSPRRAPDAQTTQSSQPTTGAQRAEDSSSAFMYLLSSPSGPQALLLSPSGTFSTAWSQVGTLPNISTSLPLPGPLVPVAHNGQHSTVQGTRDPARERQPVALDAAQLRRNQEELQRLMARIRASQAPQQQEQQQQQNRPEQQVAQPRRDIVRIMIPLGGHLWLLIRLLGFVWFFTHGASWRRTILLGGIALILFLAQTGAFRPFMQYVWEPVRRHLEAVLPLAGDEAARPENAAALNGNPPEVPTNGNQPTPEQAAERLLRERRQQNTSYVRNALRRVERAIALFVASLVPGVGERHIAAREAAEAMRQAEIREQEERRQREEQLRLQEQQQQTSERENPTDEKEGGKSEAANGHEQRAEGQTSSGAAAGEPLVEI